MSASVCVCLCVCVSVCPRAYLPNHMRDLYHFCACCLSPWLGPLPAGWRNPKGKEQFWGFLSHWQCIVQNSICDPYEHGWTDQDAVWDDDTGGPWVPWRTRSPRAGAIWGDVADHCKVIGHSKVTYAKTAEPIEILFWMKTQVGRRNHVLDWGADPPGERAILRVVPAIQKHWQQSLQPPLQKGSFNRL